MSVLANTANACHQRDSAAAVVDRQKCLVIMIHRTTSDTRVTQKRRIWPILIATLLSTAALAGPLPAGAPMAYIYPPPESGSDKRMDYYWELLHAALDATTAKWGAYVMKPSNIGMNAERSQALLADSKTISLLVRATNKEREALMRPILIPLDKGLIGYRLFLIEKPTQARLRNVRTLEDLKPFSIGQGSRWVDTEILMHAGLTVVTGGGYESLFKMLQAGRFDLFSRGINEIGEELQTGLAMDPNLAIEHNLMLYYPLPRYFFFARTEEGEQLAKRVEAGLHLMMENGQFEVLYQKFKRQMLAGLHLSGRRVFRLENPTLSAQTPLGKRQYWDTLSSEMAPKKP